MENGPKNAIPAGPAPGPMQAAQRLARPILPKRFYAKAEAAAVDGRIVQIAFLGNARAQVDFRRIMLKRLTHTGSTLRSRSIPDKAAIAHAIRHEVLPLLQIDSTYPLKDASKAHARMESSQHIGKIVLTV